MTDDEIATKRLSDWKPETDIKLQKAFGKFVEEAGELQEAVTSYVLVGNQEDTIALENEIADCLAFIEVIILASSYRMVLNPAGYTPIVNFALNRDNFVVQEVPLILAHQLG